MAFNLIKSTCDSAKSDTIAGCITKDQPYQIFNFLEQISNVESEEDLCGTIDATLQWKRALSEDFINCCEANRMEANFFMDAFGGGSPKQINTTTFHQRYRSNEDENVDSFSAGLDAAGTTQRFQLAVGSHAGSGTAAGTKSSLYVGMGLYNYRTHQMLKVTVVNDAVPNAFIITVISSTTANVDIAAGDKFLKIPAVMVGGKSCQIGASTMNSHFTTKATNKFRLRTKWCMDLEIDKPYEDELLFAQWLDKKGVAHERALPTAKSRAMSDITQAANVMLFVGNTVTNPAIDVDTWNGGEGLLESIRGAGNEYDYDPADGWSLMSDFKEIILQEDGKKNTREWLMLGSLNFLSTMTDRANKDTNFEILSTDFASISRNGIGKEHLEKYSVMSFKYLNRLFRFKEWNDMNKSNGIGNGIFPDLGILLAMDGLENSKGESIPPIQFFTSDKPGLGSWAQMEEIDRDMRFIDGCEELNGDIKKTMMWIINCPDRHYLINPVYCN